MCAWEGQGGTILRRAPAFCAQGQHGPALLVLRSVPVVPPQSKSLEVLAVLPVVGPADRTLLRKDTSVRQQGRYSSWTTLSPVAKSPEGHVDGEGQGGPVLKTILKKKKRCRPPVHSNLCRAPAGE